jgi:ferritin-like metal-binding protein YciE
MQALIEETEEKITRSTDAQIKDAALLASIQIINHFKISTYGTAAAFSKALDNNKYASFFHDVDVNEKQIDYRLTQLAEKEINMSAKAPILLHS